MDLDQNIGETLYKYAVDNKLSFTQYQNLIKVLVEVKHNILGEANASFYSILSKLENSMNNAGHEDRRSEDIHYIWAIQQTIDDKYNKFLP